MTDAEHARAYARTAERAFQRALAEAPEHRSVVTASKRAEEAELAARVLENASTLPPVNRSLLVVRAKTAAAAAGRAAGRALGSWGAQRKRAWDRGDWREYERLASIRPHQGDEHE